MCMEFCYCDLHLTVFIFSLLSTVIILHNRATIHLILIWETGKKKIKENQIKLLLLKLLWKWYFQYCSLPSLWLGVYILSLFLSIFFLKIVLTVIVFSLLYQKKRLLILENFNNINCLFVINLIVFGNNAGRVLDSRVLTLFLGIHTRDYIYNFHIGWITLMQMFDLYISLFFIICSYALLERWTFSPVRSFWSYLYILSLFLFFSLKFLSLYFLSLWCCG